MLRDIVVLSDIAFVDGGGAAVGLRSAIALAKSGRRVTVVSAVGPPMNDLLDVPNLRVICSNQQHLGTSPLAAMSQGLWNRQVAEALEAALSACSPAETVIHVHGWTKALSPSVFQTARRLGFSVVVTLHDFFAICPNGSLYLHKDEQICTLDPMSARCILTDCDSRNYAVKAYRVFRQGILNTFGGLPNSISGFISVSAFSRAIIEPHLPKDARIYDVRNPINQEREDPADPEANSRYLFLGRLSPEKGPLLFAKAAQTANVAAVFAGDGPCSDDLKTINPTVELLGWLERRDVVGQLRKTRALVLPSLWYETYGLSVMEAAALGIPSIVPDTSAARELVAHDETGLWFEGGNQASLATSLSILSQPGVAKRMGAAAYAKYWQDPPTMEKHIENLATVYEDVLSSHARVA